MNSEVLLIDNCDKFISPYIEIIKENFDFLKCYFLLTGSMTEN